MLRTAVLAILVPVLAPVLAQTPTPDEPEQNRVWADAADYARHQEENLPNFICIQTTRRFSDFTGQEHWRPIDIIVERLTYFEHKEEYKVIEVNGQPSNLGHHQLGGATSSGEFGSVMKGIFAPESGTQFSWQGWFTLRGRRMHVYSYRVPVDKSDYHIVVPNDHIDLMAAYHGLVFVDDRKHYVHRITLHADGIPASFPVQDVSLALDYEYTRIGDSDYLLPLTFELRSREGKSYVKNDVDYDSYRKFDADSSITFDSAAPGARKDNK